MSANRGEADSQRLAIMAEVERLGFFLSRAPICAGLAANELVRAGRKVEVSHSLRSPTWVQVPCDRSSFRQARVGVGGGNIAQALLWIRRHGVLWLRNYHCLNNVSVTEAQSDIRIDPQ